MARRFVLLAFLAVGCSRAATPTIVADDGGKPRQIVKSSKPDASLPIQHWAELAPRLEKCIPAEPTWYSVRVTYRADGGIDFETCEADGEVGACIARVLETVSHPEPAAVPKDALIITRLVDALGPVSYGPVRVLTIREKRESGSTEIFNCMAGCGYLVEDALKGK